MKHWGRSGCERVNPSRLTYAQGYQRRSYRRPFLCNEGGGGGGDSTASGNRVLLLQKFSPNASCRPLCAGQRLLCLSVWAGAGVTGQERGGHPASGF